MSDEDKRKGVLVAISILCFCICLGGVVCLLVSLIVVGSKSCEDLCGAKYTQEDTNYNCCANNRYNDCVVKSECGPWETLFQVGMYIVGSAVIICCCCAAANGKSQSTGVTYAAPVRKRKFILVEVDD